MKNTGFYEPLCCDYIVVDEFHHAVSNEHKRRKDFVESHQMQKYDHDFEKRSLSGRIICGSCGIAYKRTSWNYQSSKGPTYGWYCVNKYFLKGVKGCNNRFVNEKTMNSVCVDAYNKLMYKEDFYLKKWQGMIAGENLLNREKAKMLLRWLDDEKGMEELDIDFVQRTLGYITVFEDGKIIFTLVEGTEIKMIL